jgi:adenosylcobalamin-dependent ribonucleoside-triphosphate reductase
LSFKLSDEFISKYEDRPVDWGFKDAGGNSLGEITFLRTYSRLKEDGTKERWWEVCRRVIEGMFSIQRDWCTTNRLPWNHNKAQHSAQEAYERLFTFKWTPPGRGLWVMGTPLVNEQKNSAALQNCAFVSTHEMTRQDPSKPFRFLMEASMLGIGVGFDTAGADKDLQVQKPKETDEVYTVPDTREGWVEVMAYVVNGYIRGSAIPEFDFSLVRPAGAPIKTFGGTAAGPEPLQRLVTKLTRVFEQRIGDKVDSRLLADIGNLIGVCVVSGNVRRSAELLMGSIEDKDFLNLKNNEMFSERNTYSPDADKSGWGWMSNNSVAVEVGDDLSGVIEGIARNGEPGVIWMDVSRGYGRLEDPRNDKDYRARGYNPCAEQTLESMECCTLVETYLNRHDSLEDYERTLKYAYLYAKTVTLLPTHWAETNAIMQRNRRIGTSMSGIANFADNHGIPQLKKWMNEGYARIQSYDTTYSEWLGVRESIKTTTVKPSGTVSILAGESPGSHWQPGGEYFDRAIRFSKDDPIVELFRRAWYRVETAAEDPANTVVVFFPVRSLARRSEQEVSIFEKVNLAALAQRFWSDNSVSVTVSFNAETESDHVGTVLHMYEGQLKTVSFLPQGNMTYPQMPYTNISGEDFDRASVDLMKVDLSPIYDGNALDAVGEAYCTTDACEVKTLVSQ